MEKIFIFKRLSVFLSRKRSPKPSRTIEACGHNFAARGMRHSGFTLLELAVVLMIMATISAIGVILLNNIQRTAYEILAKHDLKEFVTAQDTFFIDNNRFNGNPGQSIRNDGNASDFILPYLKLSTGVVITVISGDPANPYSHTDPYIAEATHTKSPKIFEYNGWTKIITER
jgi:prepilin-type N-terminal cleavage/methylation domain-containing protein